MPDRFSHDVFLSHSAKDKAVVRAVAERLRKDGLKVWFDEWVLKAGDSIPAKIEEERESDNGKKAVKHIVFEGERFDVMSLRRWRERGLGANPVT